MLDYLRRTPSVRDVVVSGGDVANMPWPRLESFLTEVLAIDNIRDIRLATKALIGLPQHWLQPDVVEGIRRVSTIARARGVSIAIHTHANHANSVTPLVAEATRAMLDTGIRDVRNQGVILNGVNADPHALLDLCFRLLDGAQIMPYYFYMCDMIPFSEHWRVSVADAQRLQHAIMGYLPGFATPRIVCDVPFVGKRWVHQLADYDTERGISYWTKNYRTSIEAQDPEALSRTYAYYDPIHTLPADRPGVVGRARPRRRVGAQGGRGRRGLAAYGGAAGVLTCRTLAPLVDPRRPQSERALRLGGFGTRLSGHARPAGRQGAGHEAPRHAHRLRRQPPGDGPVLVVGRQHDRGAGRDVGAPPGSGPAGPRGRSGVASRTLRM